MSDSIAREGRRGYLAATVGGLTGAAAGGGVAWLLFPLVSLDGDPDLGPANLAVGLALLFVVVVGGLTVGALGGVGVALRVAGHRGIAATLATTVVLVALVGALLVFLATPLAVAAPLLAGVPAAARWVVIAVVRRRTGSS